MHSRINPLDHAVCLSEPERRAPSAWLEHTPFAMWLIAAIRPRVLVELGTYYGTSYCAFCQAIAALDLPCRAFAVDTWEGDPHNGPNSHEVLDDLKSHHDSRYSRFSTLLPMPFDEAMPRFADKEIDLLHIDGYHIYEAVRHDFETWRDKVSDRGIILFHDVAEHIADFGVWRLWEELTATYPSFTFLHEHGLGVLAIGPDIPDAVRALLDSSGSEIEPVRQAFHALGQRFRLAEDLEERQLERDVLRTKRDVLRTEHDALRVANGTLAGELEQARSERESFRAQLESIWSDRELVCQERDGLRNDREQLVARLHSVDEELAGFKKEWSELHSSRAFQVFQSIMRLVARIGPRESRRRLVLEKLVRMVEVLRRGGATEPARRPSGPAAEPTAPRALLRGDAPAEPPQPNKGNSHARIH